MLSTILFVGLIFYFLVIVYLLRKKILFLKYTFLWIFTGVGLMILVIWPELLYNVIGYVGIKSPVNGIFLFTIAFIYMIVMSLTAIVSKQSESIKTLSQNIGLLEKRIRDLEKENMNEDWNNDFSGNK